MFGLVVGVFRMVLDFSYREPLCMEEDTRPAFIGQVRYNDIISTSGQFHIQILAFEMTKLALYWL